MGKERVKVALAAEMEQVGELGVVDVRKDAQELLVDVLACGEERRWELSRCPGRRQSGEGERERERERGVERSARTSLGGKGGFVREKTTNPGHDVVNVLRRRELDLFPVLVDPCIVETGTPTWQSGSVGSDEKLRCWHGTHPGPADMVGLLWMVQNSVRTP